MASGCSRGSRTTFVHPGFTPALVNIVVTCFAGADRRTKPIKGESAPPRGLADSETSLGKIPTYKHELPDGLIRICQPGMAVLRMPFRMK